ncbi:MAG: carboxypeptidase-like regulatory domain-containing protein, partial [Candidatus Thermoplasmatota archaeon]
WRIPAGGGSMVKLTNGTEYDLNTTTGNVTFAAGALQNGDTVTAFYNYTTYEFVSYEEGLVRILDNFDLDNDTLSFSYSYVAFDDAVDKMWSSRSEDDVQARFRDAHYAVAELLPVLPLLRYDQVNSYNKTVYEGWEPALGGINNFWTYLNLYTILSDATLALSANAYPGYVTAGEALEVSIRLEDDELGTGIPGAYISISGAEGFSKPVDEGNGDYTCTYTAPSVTDPQTITATIYAAKRRYQPVTTKIEITVHPSIRYFLIEVDLDNASVDSNTVVGVTVTLTDDTSGDPVEGVALALSISPTNMDAYLETENGTTNSDGIFRTDVIVRNVTGDTYFKITVIASKEGYWTDDGSNTLFARRYGGITPNRGFLGLPAPSTILILGLIGLIAMTIAAHRRRRHSQI